MTTMHTPGPWRVTRDYQVRHTPDGFDREEIADCSTARNREANARLIAAAPDLLAVCTEALGMLEVAIPEAIRESDLREEDDDASDYLRAVRERVVRDHGGLNRLRAAIAKARGEP